MATSILLTILDVDGGKAPVVVKFENLTTTKALLRGSRSSCPRGWVFGTYECLSQDGFFSKTCRAIPSERLVYRCAATARPKAAAATAAATLVAKETSGAQTDVAEEFAARIIGPDNGSGWRQNRRSSFKRDIRLLPLRARARLSNPTFGSAA